MSDIQTLTEAILAFRDERDWKQFHTPKDMALSLCLEAAEVLEHFQWKNGEEMERYVRDHAEEIGDELSDVLFWVLLMSHDLHIDIAEAFRQKLEKTKKKYPVDKAKGKAGKYTDYLDTDRTVS
ncbi:MAG TPA: nucleotide pyrophosphohydrolase [Candidatus Kapabacteria bacterium]|nr:nucleotide pyrophosphohydrolase [Candidatus Kapabacteria bacterium]